MQPQQSKVMQEIRLRLPRLRWALRKLVNGRPAKGDVYYGDMAALYDAERERNRRWHREQTAVKAYLDQLPRGLQVLDVPVGTGRFVDYYAERGHHVTGFDSSDDMLAVARQRSAALNQTMTMTQGDATKLPYADGQFDLVVSTRFLRHVLPFELAKASLAEMARVTRGHAIIEMGCTTRATRWPAEGKPMRDQLNRADLIALFTRSGLELVGETVTRGDGLPWRLPGRRRAVYLLRKIA